MCVRFISISLPIDLLKVIQPSLDLYSWDHVMLWAACCLSFFGFLCTGEFTTNSLFDPSIHLAVSDVQADYLVDPICFQFTSGARRQTLFVWIVTFICPVVALGNFLALRGPTPGPLFCYADGCPLSRQQLSSTVQAWVTASGLAWLQQLLHGESLITLSRLLADSLVMRKMYEI